MQNAKRALRVVSASGAQTISSITTIAVNVIVARSVAPEEYGVFALALSAMYILMGIVRALTTEVMMFHYPGESIDSREAQTGSTTAAILVYVTLVPLLYLTGMVAGLDSRYAAGYAFAVAMFGARDSLRLVLIVQRKPFRAITVETVFIGVIAIISGIYGQNREVSDYWWIMVGAGIVAVTVAFWSSRTSLDITLAKAWFTKERTNGSYFLSDFILTNGVSQGSLFLVALFSGVGATGHYRSAQLLVSPVNLILRSVSIVLAPELVSRAARGETGDVRRWCLGFVWATLGMAILTVVALLGVPISWVRLLVGESADGALRIIPFSGAAMVAFGFAMAAGLGLRSFGLIRAAFRSKLVVAPVAVALVSVGTQVYGAIGAQIAVMIADAIRGGLNWRQLSSHSHDHQGGSRG